jgi:type IV pilus assembly protein PilO
VAVKLNLRGLVSGQSQRWSKDPRVTMRLVLGLLLLANLVTAAVIFGPWAVSPQDLQRRLAQLRADTQQRQTDLERLRTLVRTVEKTHAEADQFLEKYFLDSETTSSTILSELDKLTREAGVKQEEHTVSSEPIEGSDTLEMMSIEGHYEGTYADLIQFVNLLDRSPRFLIIERLQARPRQTQGLLNVSLKLNVFVREAGQGK